MVATTVRIDKLLFFLRLAKSRTIAGRWADEGHIRVNGRRIEKSSAGVNVGDFVTLPIGEVVLAFELLSVPVRRGPAVEARSCYRLLE